MAIIESFIPFLILWESGVSDPKATPEQLFLKAARKGVVSDPDDLGGATLAGITLGTFRQYCRCKNRPSPSVFDLASLSYRDWLDILQSLFWDRWKADSIASQEVAQLLVDWTWTSGSYGITIPQKVLGVKPDGIVGPKTIGVVNSSNPAELFRALKKARAEYVDSICSRRPVNSKFRNGWIRRLNALPAPK